MPLYAHIRKSVPYHINQAGSDQSFTGPFINYFRLGAPDWKWKHLCLIPRGMRAPYGLILQYTHYNDPGQ